MHLGIIQKRCEEASELSFFRCISLASRVIPNPLTYSECLLTSLLFLSQAGEFTYQFLGRWRKTDTPGALRPATHLALNLLRVSSDICITILPDRRAAKRIKQELSAHSEVVSEFKDRLRIYPVIDANGPDLGNDDAKVTEEFKVQYGGTLTKVLNGEGAEGILKTAPKLVVIDVSRMATVYAMAEQYRCSKVNSRRKRELLQRRS